MRHLLKLQAGYARLPLTGTPQCGMGAPTCHAPVDQVDQHSKATARRQCVMTSSRSSSSSTSAAERSEPLHFLQRPVQRVGAHSWKRSRTAGFWGMLCQLGALATCCTAVWNEPGHGRTVGGATYDCACGVRIVQHRQQRLLPLGTAGQRAGRRRCGLPIDGGSTTQGLSHSPMDGLKHTDVLPLQISSGYPAERHAFFSPRG